MGFRVIGHACASHAPDGGVIPSRTANWRSILILKVTGYGTAKGLLFMGRAAL